MAGRRYQCKQWALGTDLALNNVHRGLYKGYQQGLVNPIHLLACDGIIQIQLKHYDA